MAGKALVPVGPLKRVPTEEQLDAATVAFYGTYNASIFARAGDAQVRRLATLIWMAMHDAGHVHFPQD